MKFIAVIPARYASTRFPGKPLAMLGGRPVIQHVYENALKALDSVVVATDDSRILRAVEGFGGRAVMTRPDHPSGTDRCYEAVVNVGTDADVVINIQGDEPFVHPSQIQSLMECFDRPDTQIATLVREFDPAAGFDALANPNTPKVVVDDNGYALYFSRSVIPYVRGVEQGQWPSATRYFTHLGMYAFRREALDEIVSLPPSSLELAEKLEQLRWLQHGMRIRVAVTPYATIGIDTPADLERAEQYLASQRSAR